MPKEPPLPIRHFASSCVLSLLFFLLAIQASALDSTLQVSQYAHTAWNARDGFFRGAVLSITQTNDGYLWLGTGFGLLRFDGVRFTEWRPPQGSVLPKPPYRKLYASRDGSLWVGADNGLARIRDGSVTNFQQMNLDGATAITEDKDGTIWTGSATAGGRKALLCAIREAQVNCVGQGGEFGHWIRCLYEDSAGTLWVASTPGVWRWMPGNAKLYPGDGPAIGLSSDERGTILFANYHEVRALIDERDQAYPMQDLGGAISAEQLFRDKDGGVWIAAAGQGLLHMHQGRIDKYRAEDGLSNNSVVSFFEDREGSIWVGTTNGLDRFHQLPIATTTARQGVVADDIGAVLVTRDSSLWTSGEQGLNREQHGIVTSYSTKNGLPDSYVSSIFEGHDGRLMISTAKGAVLFKDGQFIRTPIPGEEFFAITQDGADNYWISEHDTGLIHANADGKILDITPWKEFQHQFARSLAVDPFRGGLWVGFYNFSRLGLVLLKDRKVVEQYGPEQGFKGQVTDIQTESDGTVWAATEGGLARIRERKVAILDSSKGLPCDNAFWKRDDAQGNVWVLMACGLVRVDKTALNAWADNPQMPIKVISTFDQTEGVDERAQPGYYGPQVAKTDDGRLLFVQDGLASIDPRKLSKNQLKPTTIIEQIAADGKDYELGISPLRIPPLPRDLRIDYTALSLVDPRKVRFRYQLEGQDPTWQDPGTRRQAFYSDLRPGRYRFHVIACNNDGIWNEEGASVEFRIASAWFQTAWFRVLCAVAVLLILWTAYKIRVRQIQSHMTLILEERVKERTRIARELHDSLLQGFQGLMFRLQAVRQLMPGRSSEAIAGLDVALGMGDQAITQAREAVQGLRLPAAEDEDLAQSLSAMAADLASSDSRDSPRAQVLIEGNHRSITPLVRREVCAIASESLRNAFQHSKSTQIQVKLSCRRKVLLLSVQDDGIGIGPAVLALGGRADHFGLPGMNERAARVGGQLIIRSELGQGTEVVLSVPGRLAYSGRLR